MASLLKIISINLFVALSLLLSYMIYNILEQFEVFKKLQPINDKNCKIVRGGVGIEDFAQYDKDYLIGISDELLKNSDIYRMKFDNIKNGSIITFDINKEIITQYPIIGLPQEIAFHPHGIYLYQKKFLYIINHAYKQGGERIEVVRINKKETCLLKPLYLCQMANKYLFNKIFQKSLGNYQLLADEFSFTYEKSLLLPQETMGITNDLVVVGPNDNIFITTYLPYTETIKGKIRTLWDEIKYIISGSLRMKNTHIYYCETILDQNTKNTTHSFACKKLNNKDTYSFMNNGIAYDSDKDLVFVCDVFERRIKVFKRSDLNKSELTLLTSIYTSYASDNVHLSKSENGDTILTLGSIGKPIQFLIFQMKSRNKKKFVYKDYFGGVERITIPRDFDYGNKKNTSKNIVVETLVMQDDYFKGVSSGYQIGDKVYLSSYCDDGILVCKITKS